VEIKVLENVSNNTFLPELEITDKAIDLAKEFRDAAQDAVSSDGSTSIGLAAPQIGLEKRICAVKGNTGWIAAINPSIVGTKGGDFATQEGCLTWPNKLVLAIRYSNVEVVYHDADKNELVTEWFHGLVAVIFQHEIDHLNGVKEKLIDKKDIFPELKHHTHRNDACICGSRKKFKKCCSTLMYLRYEEKENDS